MLKGRHMSTKITKKPEDYGVVPIKTHTPVMRRYPLMHFYIYLDMRKRRGILVRDKLMGFDRPALV